MDLNRMQQLAGIIPTRSGLSESSQVGKTILQQMGGLGRITAMLGAKNIVLSDNGVSFRWPNKERSKGNGVRITLDPSDTYTMEFLNVSGSSAKTVKKYTDVYNDQLVSIFEKQTGWFLSLGGSKKPVGSGKKPGPEVDPSNATAGEVEGGSGKFWTVSSMDGTFDSLDAAKKAWFAAGKPKAHGNSVWASEHHGEKTLRTVTLNTSMESKLDELRALLGEKKKKPVEAEDNKDCYCKDGDDCDCNDEGDNMKEEREFSQDQLDVMEAVQGYKLPFYARTKTSDGEQWFRATGTLKNGNFSGMMLDAGAAGRSSSKAKKGSLDAKWAKSSWDEVDADKVPPKIKSALGEAEEDCGCDPIEEDGAGAGGAGAGGGGGDAGGAGAGGAAGDAGGAMGGAGGGATPPAAPGGPPPACNHCNSPQPMTFARFVGGFPLWMCANCGHKHKGKKHHHKKKHESMEELLQSVRDVVEGKKTYSQAHGDIMTGLEKHGWAVKKTGPDGKPLKVPHATSPTGAHKLFFKTQSIHHTHGKGDLGNARSLWTPDVRDADFDAFAKHLSKWTGKDLKDNPLPKEAPKSLTPDQYHAKHGECPSGYHFDADSKRCVKAAGEGTAKQCPECMEDMKYDDGKDAWTCNECGYVGPNGPAMKGVAETLRLAGINRYAENVVRPRPASMTMTGLVREIRKYATDDAHLDWTTDEAYAAPMTGAPGGDEDVDVWNPGDSGQHIAGRPDTKGGAPKKPAAPADKNAALLKALKCPPGKEAKLVYGRPSCAPSAKA